MTLPRLLSLIAVLVFALGATRLSMPAQRPSASTKRALLLWLVLFASSSLAWLLFALY